MEICDRMRKIALYGAEAVYIDTDRVECLNRLMSDCNRSKSQKKEWTVYINRWFDDYTDE